MVKPKSKLILEFAGLACKITCPNKESLDFLKKRFKSSLFCIVKRWKGNPGTMAFLSLSEKKPRQRELAFRLTYILKNLHFKAWYTTSVFFFFPAINQALARIFSFLTFKNDGLILHASCVVKNNEAYVFVGPARSGKSTVAQLSKSQYKVLSDNDTFILKKRGEFLAFPSPFIETVSGNNIKTKYSKGVRIKGLFLLKRAKKHQIVPLGFQKALEMIKNNSEFPMSPKNLFNAQEKKRFQKLIFDFLGESRVYLLYFKKDPQFWRKIDENC